MDKQQPQNRLEHFPISFFSIVMGLSGLTIAWTKAQHAFGTDLAIHSVLAGITSLIFAVLLIIYSAKVAFHPASVIKELQHPVKLSFSQPYPLASYCYPLLFLKSIKQPHNSCGLQVPPCT